MRILKRMLVLSLACAMALAVACDDEEVDPCDPANAVTINVEHGAQNADVDLGTLTGTQDGDLCLVDIVDIINAANLGLTLTDYYYDFEADDGFRASSSSQPGCTSLDGTQLQGGTADMSTGTLSWDDSLGLGGCWRVRNTIKVHVLDDPITD